MAGAILDESTIPLIRGRFQGELLEPGDDGYDEARTVYNALIDRRPRLIVRCAGAADVVAGILLARETGLPLAVKGGGHGVNGHAVCDDGIMLDLSPLKRIDIDPMVAGGMVLWSLEQAGEVLRFYRDWMESAPDEVSGGAAVVVGPPEEFVPAELQGKPVFAVIPISFGDPELLRPIREVGSPFADLVGPMPYVEVQKLLDPGSPWGFLNYWKAEAVQELSDELIDLNLEHAAEIRSPLTAAFFQPLGAALSRLPEDATAINPSPGGWVVHALAVWETEAESEYELAWVREWGEFMEPYVRAGVPLTFSADTGDDRVRATFGEEKYARLVTLGPS